MEGILLERVLDGAQGEPIEVNGVVDRGEIDIGGVEGGRDDAVEEERVVLEGFRAALVVDMENGGKRVVHRTGHFEARGDDGGSEWESGFPDLGAELVGETREGVECLSPAGEEGRSIRLDGLECHYQYFFSLVKLLLCLIGNGRGVLLVNL